jgi:Uma2 family endonuclease
MIAARENERYFTPEEYFSWEEEQLEKHELIEGRVYVMSGGTQNHSAIAINFLLSIKFHLRGSKCKVFNSDLKVNIFNTPKSHGHNGNKLNLFDTPQPKGVEILGSRGFQRIYPRQAS